MATIKDLTPGRVFGLLSHFVTGMAFDFYHRILHNFLQRVLAGLSNCVKIVAMMGLRRVYQRAERNYFPKTSHPTSEKKKKVSKKYEWYFLVTKLFRFKIIIKNHNLNNSVYFS